MVAGLLFHHPYLFIDMVHSIRLQMSLADSTPAGLFLRIMSGMEHIIPGWYGIVVFFS